MAVSLNEQETTISFGRTEKTMTIWTSDTTMMTKLDHLCESSPKNYRCIEADGFKLSPGEIASKKYVVSDKTLLTLRSKKVVRELTDEQRKELSERMRTLSARQKEQREGGAE